MKKAQGGMNAAILLAVIGGLIIAYVIFLPADEREALLQNKSIEDVRGGKSISDGRTFLLREYPGRLNTVEDIDDKQLANVFLRETTNAKELEKINPFIVRSGWFDKKSRVITFRVDELENTDNVLLSFQTKKNEGVLTIKHNDMVIYEGDINSNNIEPIKLQKQVLKEDNELLFFVSSVGYKFWSTNEYQIENAKIIADVTDKSSQESSNIFTLSATEIFNAQEANLRFVPYCKDEEDVGTLEIAINNKNLFSAIPVCEDSYKQPIPLSTLKEGQNTISLKTNKGSYSIEQIRIEFDEEDIQSNVYFFEVNASTKKDIKEDGLKVKLNILFQEGNDQKRADINVNDKFFTLDQEDKDFTEDITDIVEDGNNFIEIMPRSRLDIVEVNVRLEKK